MRVIWDDERALLNRRRRRVNYTVEVERPDGSWTILNRLYGREWVKSVRISEDIDSPSMELQVELQREWEKTSLSPLMEDSRANRATDASLKPLLELDSRIVVWCSISTEDSRNEEWMQIFNGRITNVDPSGAAIRVVARDPMHDLVTAWIETKEQQLGSTDGTPVETLIQGILDTWLPGVTLWTPVSPNWLVNLYKQERMPVYEALNTIVMQFGWDLRYRYGLSNAYRLTLSEPGREKTSVDYIFTKDDYYDLSGMDVNLDGVRNVVVIGYGPQGARAQYTARRSTSVTKWRITRTMWIEESSDSPIQTQTQAAVMAGAADDDLKDPKYAMSCTMPIFPWAQLGDIYTFSANAVHFDRNKNFSLAGYTHELKGGKATTTMKLCDGQPSTAYGRWLEKEYRRGVKFL